MKKGSGARSLLQYAADRFDLPAEVLAGAPKLTLTGAGRLHIENHRGILEYGQNLITVNAGQMILKIMGSKLELVSMSAEELLITGHIAGIDLE